MGKKKNAKLLSIHLPVEGFGGFVYDFLNLTCSSFGFLKAGLIHGIVCKRKRMSR